MDNESSEPTEGQAAAEHDEWILTEEGSKWYDEQQNEKYRVWMNVNE